MRWQDFISGPDGAKRLASLQAAVKKMKSLDSSPSGSIDYRRSWQYWANIHGYYGSQSRDGTVKMQIDYLESNGFAKYVPYYQGITDQAPPDSVAAATWATCQHSGDTQALNFFAWHRMYLYYFERVLRWAAGDDSLRLPYWDYTDPTQETLPTAFRDVNSVLYDSRRNPDINSGASALSPMRTNVNRLLGQPDYFAYESGIEEGIHGYVHCTVGPTCPVAHMGDVPVAGNDPIFYFHHANVDRLWACWQNLHPTPTGAWQNQTFSFPDETGNLQTRPVKDFLDSVPLGYVYDNAQTCARPGSGLTATRSQAVVESKNISVVGISKSIAIDRPQVEVNIDVPKAKLLEMFGQPDNRIEPTDLVLRDITADSPPGVLFDVYLKRRGVSNKQAFVGTISWFNVFGVHNGKRMNVKRTFTFDVTTQLRELAPSGEDLGVTVAIEATMGQVDAKRSNTEGLRIAAVEAFRPQAKVRIGAIELRHLNVSPVSPNR